MKYEKWIYGMGSLAVVVGAMMKILHLPYANIILMMGFLIVNLYQTWQVAYLKRRVNELEQKQ